MRIQGHVAEGVIVGAVAVAVSQPEPVVAGRLLLLGGFFGGLPDLDALIYMAKHRTIRVGTDFRHHTWVTHTFPFYLIPAALGVWFASTAGRPDLAIYAWVFGWATAVHLLQDMWGSGDGIMAFYPLSRRMYGVALTGTHGPDWERDYRKGPVFKVELAAEWIALALVAVHVVARMIGN